MAAPERGERAHGDDFAHGQRVDRAGALLLAAPGIVLDGQLIGFAIPVLIREWGITRGAFAPAVAAGLIGMGIVCVALFAVRRHIPRLSRAAAQPREGEELARTSS
ncbi:putative 4-hydroxybenzoate hydroxylase [Burkholderia cepacia]|nr:putative 4-hydroxybenzoate hydroxylase [Burkholderia cepacia]